MKAHLCLTLAVLGLLFSSRAQVPPAEQLLPDDTIALVTIPDWTKLTEMQNQTSFGQLWDDPAMKPFRQNFVSNLQADFIQPIEKELGISLKEYQELLRGQITLALLPPKEDSAQFASALLMLDTKDKSELLTSKLAELRKKWTESGKEVKTEKIREIEFSAISFNKQDIDKFLQKVFPSSDADEEEEESATGEKTELLIGQFKSLLLVSENAKTLEKVLARQSGGLVPPLAEQAAYQRSHSKLFRDSMVHGWVNVQPIYERLLKFAAAERPPEENQPGMPQMNLSKILPALGLSSLHTIAGKLSFNADGTSADFFASVPEASREGIFRLFTLQKKESGPPAFVPANVISFQRTRLDAQKAWTTLEEIITKVDPSIASLVQLMLSTAGKDQDPNFDLKKNLIGNLGDDFIQYQKAPKSTAMEDLSSPPSIFLIGSPDAPALADAVRMITSLLPPPLSSAPLKEREFLGRKIYSLSMAVPQAAPAENGEEPAMKEQTLSFSASGGYVAITTDTPMLEEYLRSSENPPKPLRAVTGLAEAAQQTLGMDSGLFAYEDQSESMKVTMRAIKENPETFGQGMLMMLSQGGGAETFGRYFDLKLLPEYDRIAKYFGFVVSSAGTTPEGFFFEGFSPRPAGLAR